MNCKKIQEIILTDYLDGQLDQAGRENIHRHLSQCGACSAFIAKAEQAAIEPFANTQPAEPPADLWETIKSAIEPKQRNPFRIFFIPKPVFALSSTLAAALIGLLLIRSPQFFHGIENKQLAKAYLEEQADFFDPNGPIGLNGDEESQIYSL